MIRKARKNKVKRNKYPKKVKKDNKVKVCKNEIPITLNNRLNYTFEYTKKEGIARITCVALSINVGSDWITIVRYDNVHGYMHRHLRISLKNGDELVTTDRVKQKGTQKQLLSWTVKDIKNQYKYYKRVFLKRSGFSRSKIKDLLY